MAAKGSATAFVRLRSKTTGAWLVHPDLRPRLVAEAAEKQTNLTDLILTILCSHFNVRYETKQRTSQPQQDADVLLFGMPPELERAISLAYPVHRLDGVRYALCSYFGLRVPAKAKQTRQRRTSTVA